MQWTHKSCREADGSHRKNRCIDFRGIPRQNRKIERFSRPRSATLAGQTDGSVMKPPLQVMKFGGTSVGDAGCIARAAKIIAEATRAGKCVAVVSAMGGV